MTEPPPFARPPWLAAAAGARLLVLGADGFIGSHVTRAALAAGAEVTAVCAKSPWRLAADPKVTVIDLGQWWDRPSRLRDTALAEADAIVMLLYHPPRADLDDARRAEHERAVNLGAAAAVADAAASSGRRVVFSSSADVYGHWADGPVSETDAPRPATPYAAAKLDAERHVHTTAAAVVLRIATVYGPGENGPRAIPSFVRALAGRRAPLVHGTGEDVRDYVHVWDVAAAIVNAAVAGEAVGSTLNVGSGTGRTTLEVLEAVARAFGVPPSPEFAPASRAPSRLVLDVRAAQRVLSLEPSVDFDAGVRDEARWLVQQLEEPPTARRNLQ